MNVLILRWVVSITVTIYLLVLCGFYFFQQKLLFLPKVLPENYSFSYELPYEELFFNVDDQTALNGLLFKSDSSKGLVFFLHGNSGALDTWGKVANTFVSNNYDCFILDYRGYGKSQGHISNENQLYRDINIVYQDFLTRYSEEDVIVVGYSIGTGPSAQLASINNPKRLILQAPYNNIATWLKSHYLFVPSFLIRYKLTTDKYIVNVTAPITIFHGDQDKIIPYECSLKLSKMFTQKDELIKLTGLGHLDFCKNLNYIKNMNRILNG